MAVAFAELPDHDITEPRTLDLAPTQLVPDPLKEALAILVQVPARRIGARIERREQPRIHGAAHEQHRAVDPASRASHIAAIAERRPQPAHRFGRELEPRERFGLRREHMPLLLAIGQENVDRAADKGHLLLHGQ